jgi:DNA-binding NarL/FixJ family response regulator
MRLEKQRLSDEIEFKNKELTLNVMNLIKKNEMLVDLTNRLIQMQQNVKDPSTKQEFIQLINSLQRTSSSEIWEEFEMRFRQVHNSFYEKLLSRFPELTPSELKLAALLRLNLSTKEICELSGQRPASLDVARSRLRKKLGLANSQINLVTFLSQI